MARGNWQGGYGPGSVQVRIGARFTPGVVVLLVLFTASFLLTQVGVVRAFVVRHLVVIPVEALGRAPYQLLTGPLFVFSFLQLLFLGILLWSIGSAVEQRLGARRFVLYSLLSSVAAALGIAATGRLHALINPASLAGELPIAIEAGPVFMMVLVAFSSLYGSLPVRMWGIGQPISGRALAYFFIGLGLLADLLRMQIEQLVGSLVAIGVSAWLCRGHGGPSLLSDLGGFFRRLGRRLSLAIRRRRAGGIEVLDGGRAPSSRSGRTAPSGRSGSSGGRDRWLN
jgi:membrane associated rhomboid family serine protease